MPLCRYQIRNEFRLADREVYKAADKDDPEALLEGFAMAGLVGLLRQLGDLAEFAAEIFSDLHDEVAATASRSHGVMVRVQHLEIEIPLIQKTFLKQTNHSSFFHREGIDWHPNLHIEQNCITKGDLPRFVADSYEETRGPPSFILLDRFDIGGDGACLKRYSNPSLYKVEDAALGTTNSDVHGERKIHKGKRRGTQWRNGRTPKALPTLHAKLHQLVLEETIEDNVNDPARHVKLKRRLNGFPFHLKTGKGYMKKILKDHSTDHELLKRVGIDSVPSDLDAEVERQFNGSVSRNMLTNKDPSQKPELKNVGSDHILGANNSSSSLHEDVAEKKIIVDREKKAKATMAGYQSDEITGEVEIYIDTLASEPHIYSDPKLVTKTDSHVLSNRKQVSGLHVTKSLHQAHFPDSQPTGSSTLSDDGISSLNKCISTSSYSDGVNEKAKSVDLEAGVSNAYLINEIFEDKNTSRKLKWRGCAGCNDALSSDNTKQTVSNDIPAQRDEDATMGDHGILNVQKGGIGAQDLPGTEPSNSTESEIKLEQNVPCNSNTSINRFQMGYGWSFGVFATKQALTSVEDKHEFSPGVPNISATSYSRRASKDQDMEELEEEDPYLDPDDGVLVTNDENRSTCSPKCQLFNGSADDDSYMAEHPPKLTPEGSSLKELDRDFGNEASGTCSKNQSIMNGAIVSVTPEEEVSASSLNMHQGEDGIDCCKASLVETGVSEADDGNLLLKSHLKQRETSNDLDQEEYHIISPLSLLGNRKNQQAGFHLLTQGNASKTDVEMPNVPLDSVSPVFNLLPEAVLEKVPPVPPCPPVQWKMRRYQPISLSPENKALLDNDCPSLSQNMTNQKTPRDAVLGKDLPLIHESTSGDSVHDSPFSSLVHFRENHGEKQLPSLGKIESINQKPAANLDEMSQHDDHIRPNPNTILQGATADATAAGDTGQTHDLAPLNQEQGAPLRNPLIDTIAAHDKTKLKKVTERNGSTIQISDGRDSLLEQIRAKAFNLKPTVVKRPSIQIQGPTSNLRVTAILEKAKTIRHAFSGSDEDENSWSD